MLKSVDESKSQLRDVALGSTTKYNKLLRLLCDLHDDILQEVIAVPVSYTHLTLPTKRIV